MHGTLRKPRDSVHVYVQGPQLTLSNEPVVRSALIGEDGLQDPRIGAQFLDQKTTLKIPAGKSET